LGRDDAAVEEFEVANVAVLEVFRAAHLVKLKDLALPGDAAAAGEVRRFLAVGERYAAS
jgi:hypothetical protein